MKQRIDQELELLRSIFPDLEYRADGRWIRLPRYPLRHEWGWEESEVAVALQFPPGFPGQKPYGFHISPRPTLRSGAPLQNTGPSESPFAGEWLKFSWDVPEWAPGEDARSGSNMLNYLLTIADRLSQGA